MLLTSRRRTIAAAHLLLTLALTTASCNSSSKPSSSEAAASGAATDVPLNAEQQIQLSFCQELVRPDFPEGERLRLDLSLKQRSVLGTSVLFFSPRDPSSFTPPDSWIRTAFELPNHDNYVDYAGTEMWFWNPTAKVGALVSFKGEAHKVMSRLLPAEVITLGGVRAATSTPRNSLNLAHLPGLNIASKYFDFKF